MKRIFLPIFVVLLLLFPVSAAEVSPVDVLYDSASVSQWNAYFQGKPLGGLSSSESWQLIDGPVRAAGIGAMDSHATLERRLLTFERKYADVRSGFLQSLVNLVLDVDAIRPVIDYDSSLGIYRLKDSRSGIWIVSLDGSFPYYRPSSTVDPDTGETSVSLGGQWIQYSKVNWNRVNILTEYSLYDIGYALRDIGQDNDVKAYFSGGSPKYQYIASRWTAGAVGEHYVYCDEDGQPYVYRPAADEWAQEDDNPYYTDDDGDNIFDDGDTVKDQLIDLDSNTVWFPNGTLQYINNLVYDESTKTYYVDAHEEYNFDNDTYITNNYYYEYHINYTSVTYIGQTEEYDEKYEFYYQLPDGRNSADLTLEELQALNTQIDVLPYVRSADDVSIRALYHFDGNTRDSSYWSHLGNLKWNKGATLTYMDVGAFNGALYLDENEHDFTITLPSNVSTGDFTLQFRFYQSHTEAPVTDSYVKLGGYVLFGFDGASIKNAPGVDLSPMPTGTWNELCFMRKDGDFAYFLNGVCLYSGKNFTRAFNNQLQFTFGNQQQTFKYLDEIRFVSKAIYSMDGYTPSSVPFDTNLSLVLPDSKLPVADAYWSIVSEKENLLSPYGLDSWINLSESDLPSLTHTALTSYKRQSAGSNYYTYQPGPVLPYTSAVANSASPAWSSYINSTGCNFLSSPTGTAFVATSNSLFSGNGVTSTTVPVTTYNTAISSSPLAYSYFVGAFPYGFNFFCGADHNKTVKTFIPTGKTYTLSMVAADGSIGSFSFDLSPTHTLNERYSYVFNGYEFGFAWVETWAESTSAPLFSRLVFFIVPTSFGSQSEFLYMQLVEGDSTDLTAEYVESVVVMDKDDLNTPSLAVRTDVEITGYQIGGVRPSLPTKGLVWALVEAGRISSLQIYDGQAWEQVDGRIWTGSRWVPYYAYDVLLLKDLWDIVEGDPTLDFIYTEEGFWKWLQDAWGQMMGKLDQIIAALGGTVKDPASECPHTYSSKVAREPTCTEPGHMTYTCDLCGHTYTELIDATGHDWVVTNTVPDVLDEEGNVIEEGYEELTCSKCDNISRDYGDGPEEVDLFDALGDFIADGITWILDKLTELADSLKGITETFNGFVEKVKGLAGGYPAFFGAFMALIPEDISTILWFAVIGFVVLAVWKKWSN